MQTRTVNLTLHSILSHSWVISASVHDYHSSPWPARMWESRVKEKRVSVEEIAGWHHRCDGHELRQTLGDGEGQGGLAYCSPWGCKEMDTNEQQQQSRTYPENLSVGSGTFVFLPFFNPDRFYSLIFSHLFFPKRRGFFIVLLQITWGSCKMCLLSSSGKELLF